MAQKILRNPYKRQDRFRCFHEARRTGYYSWGGTPDSTVDYDPDSLVYRFTGLAPDSFYLLGVRYFEGGTSRGREQSLFIDGVEVHGRSLLPGKPSKMVYLVPKRTYRDSAIVVSFVRDQGSNAVVAQLWLYRAHFEGGGPQSAGEVRFTSQNTFLMPPRPNPTAGRVEVEFHLPGPGQVTLGVYNVLGQRIKNLVNGTRLGGSYYEPWDGRDESGLPVKSGVYFVRLRAGGVCTMQKIVVTR